MKPSIAYSGGYEKILGLTIGTTKFICPECGQKITAKPVKERRSIGAAG